MPPRTTQKSHRPRVSDRTMVGNCHPLLASAKEAAGRMRKNMTPRTSHKGEKQNHALEKCIAAANRGWMSEKFLPPADQGKCFYLTSPFIEPALRPHSQLQPRRRRWLQAAAASIYPPTSTPLPGRLMKTPPQPAQSTRYTVRQVNQSEQVAA